LSEIDNFSGGSAGSSCYRDRDSGISCCYIPSCPNFSISSCSCLSATNNSSEPCVVTVNDSSNSWIVGVCASSKSNQQLVSGSDGIKRSCACSAGYSAVIYCGGLNDLRVCVARKDQQHRAEQRDIQYAETQSH